MHFTSLVLTSVLATSTLVFAAPTRNGRGTKMMTSSPKTNITGAVYFITNEEDDNRVVAASIDHNGTLSLDRAVSTRGGGAHGITDPNGPDPLFSQSSIKASQKGEVLAAVNAGSNTISLFSINPKVPTEISRLGNPVSSEGEFPVSLAFNDNGDRLCVLNGGSVNGVNCFTVDKNKGLKPIDNSLRSLDLNQTNPGTGLDGSGSQVLFSEDGKQLLASVKGDSRNNGFIAVWDVDNNGALSQDFKRIDPPSGGAQPFSMTLIPGKNALLVADPAVGFTIVDLKSNQSSAVKIDGQKTTGWSSLSGKTGNFFLTDVDTSIVTEVSVDDDLKGTVVKQTQLTDRAGTIDNDIATIGDKDFLFVLSANATNIDVLSLEGRGNAKKVQTLGFEQPAKDAGVNINGFNVQGMTHFLTQ